MEASEQPQVKKAKLEEGHNNWMEEMSFDLTYSDDSEPEVSYQIEDWTLLVLKTGRKQTPKKLYVKKNNTYQIDQISMCLKYVILATHIIPVCTVLTEP